MNKEPKYTIERMITLRDNPEIPEQILNENSWVMISSKLNGENKVFVFNNETMPESYQYADFNDWATYSAEDISATEKTSNKERFPRISPVEYSTPLNLFINKDGKQDADGWSNMVIDDDGISCHVLQFYNGGVTADNLSSKVKMAMSSCVDVVSDYSDGVSYDKELERERRLQP